MFPVIKHINDLLPFVENREGFSVKDYGDYTTINYNSITADFGEIGSVERPYLLECRGIKFCSKTGKLLQRGFHKFFNYNETLENLPENVDLSNSHKILFKLDGSMVAPIWVDNNFRLTTKAGITDVAMQAEEFIVRKFNYTVFLQEMEKSGITPIFEWVSRQQRIVIDYPEDNLILTALRYKTSGQYVFYETMKNVAEFYKIPVVNAKDSSTNILELFESVKQIQGEEGVVIRFDTGRMLKIKGEQYCSLHKTKEKIHFEHNLLQVILSEGVDDLISLLPTHDAEMVKNYWQELKDNIHHETLRIWRLFSDNLEIYKVKKDFAINFVNNIQIQIFKPLMFKLFDIAQNKIVTYSDVESLVLETLNKNSSGQKELEHVRLFLPTKGKYFK